MLDDAEEIFGGKTPTAVCRELTKSYEEVLLEPLNEIRNHFQVNEPRGEFVVIFKGSTADLLDAAHTEKEVRQLLQTGNSASDILERIQSITALSRKQLYDLITRLKRANAL
jgi:16S rRNA (cytidine1402-2'-O)-methyltransferase